MQIAMAGRHGIDADTPASSALLVRERGFHALDLLRGYGAALIVIFHAAYIYGLGRPEEACFLVDMFFVMSGFVIPLRYEIDLHGGMSFATFAKIRLIRLYPLFLLGAVFGVVPSVVAVLCGQADSFHLGMLSSFPLAAVMAPSTLAMPRVDALYPLNYVGWSLTLELIVNLAYAATARIWTWPRLAILIAATIAALALCTTNYGSLEGGYSWAHAPVGPVRAVFGFAVGLALFRLYTIKPFGSRVPWWVLLATILVFCLNDAPIDRPLWDLALVTIVSPAIIFAAIGTTMPRHLYRLCTIGGVYSYVIYSLHVPLIALYLYAQPRLLTGLPGERIIGALFFSALVLGGSIAAHLWFDTPVRRFLSKRWVWTKPRPEPRLLRA